MPYRVSSHHALRGGSIQNPVLHVGKLRLKKASDLPKVKQQRSVRTEIPDRGGCASEPLSYTISPAVQKQGLVSCTQMEAWGTVPLPKKEV